MKRPVLILTALALCACQSLSPLPDAPTGVSLQGRIKITLPDEVISSNLRWTQTQTGFDAYLWGAMGAGTTHLYGNSETLSIESGETHASGPPDEILREQLGWTIPVDLLLSWVHGQPSDDSSALAVKRNDQGVIQSFRQAGWSLEFAEFDDEGRYSRLSATSGDLSVLVLVKGRMESQSQ